MATLTVRLDDRLYEELSRVAEAKGVTLSELARRTLGGLVRRDGIEELRDLSPGSAPDSMSTVERHQLAVLHRILGLLVDPDGMDEARAHEDRMADILERGYVEEYEDVFVAIEPELSRRETGLVMDILDMFLHLEWSYERLDAKERKSAGEWAQRMVQFRGFDLNHRLESRLLSFARHLIEDGKWERLARYFDKDHERGNSHMPSLAIYERMLNEFNPIWREKARASSTASDYLLTPAEIKRVTDAAIHPDNRR